MENKATESSINLVKVGEYWPGQGGIYAGVIRDPASGIQWHLILGTETADSPKDNKYAKEHCAFNGSWGQYGETIEGEFSLNDGLHNTNLILAAEPENYLAIAIKSLSIDGHTDFYSPAQAEQQLLTSNLRDKLTKQLHWTSTQYSANHAWFQHCEDGSTYIISKDGKLALRAVRRILVI